MNKVLILLSVFFVVSFIYSCDNNGDQDAASPVTPMWVLKANYVDACSCDMACPCIFGGSPTRGYCKGATLVEIKEGHYGQVDLSDVTVLAVYNSGEWIKFFVSENATMI